ncbi:hypothetical protein [Adlercreutzia murintestinalis]|uniref:hypothetical protein n=1 Tax=Adlercreutzia murintestinalis TaxID=2941325 RepID=UPI00203A3BC0|nr:hypothetical protein [Adlercreutzia murintestinalis]
MFANKNGFAAKLISMFLASTLVVTMVPAQGLAAAVDEASTRSDTSQGTATSVGNAISAGSSADASNTTNANGDQAAAINPISQDVPLGNNTSTDQPAPEGSAAPQIASATARIANGTADRASDIEIVSTAVDLSADQATILSYNGLSYRIDAENPTQATLVGWGTAPEGDLEIPSDIPFENGNLTVTGISLGGGMGSLPKSC